MHPLSRILETTAGVIIPVCTWPKCSGTSSSESTRLFFSVKTTLDLAGSSANTLALTDPPILNRFSGCLSLMSA